MFGFLSGGLYLSYLLGTWHVVENPAKVGLHLLEVPLESGILLRSALCKLGLKSSEVANDEGISG